MKNRKSPYLLFTLILVVTGLGLNILLASSSFLAQLAHGDPAYYFSRQLVFALIGIALMIIFSQVHYEVWKKAAWPLYFGGLVLLLMVFVPGVAKTAGGASRWLDIAGFSLQPSDPAKFAVVLIVARLYSNFYGGAAQEGAQGAAQGEASIWQIHAAAGALVIVPAVLIGMEPDFGTALHLVFAASLLMVLAGLPLFPLFIAAFLSLPIVYYNLIKVPYRWNRIKAFLDPYQYRFEGAYQLIASFKSFLSGGLWGQGLGEGLRRHNLQARHTDFIFSIVAEDLGLVGVVFVLGLYFFIAGYALYLLADVEETFGRLLGSGIILLFIIQSILNVAVAMGLLPTTGINLPVFSYGGTSMLTYLGMFGILLNILKVNHG